MCQEIPSGYSRKRENVKVLTNSGEQRGQDQNDKNTTLKTKTQMNNMDPTKKSGVDSGAHQSLLPAGHPPCSSYQIRLEEGHQENRSSFIWDTVLSYLSTKS